MTKEERDRREAFGRVVECALAGLGGRAAVNDVAVKARESLKSDVYISLTWPGFVSLVRKHLHEPDEAGMPKANSIGGEYVQRALFTPADYRDAIAAYCKRGRGQLAIARRLAEECAARYDETIDVDLIWDDMSAES